MKLYILLLLPVFTSQLGVHIDVALQKENVNIQLLGEDDHVIEDSEISAFRLHDQALKDACAAYSGGRPTDVYLRSPTPWGDLYQKYAWTQVHRLLKPIKATVLGINSEPVIIATEKFHNNISRPTEFTADIKQQVSTTFTNSWSSADSIKVGQELSYSLTIPVGKVGGKTSVSYEHKWGKDGSESNKVTVGVKSGTTVTVQPGKTAIATMTADRGTMEIEVTYEATVYGHVAANYEEGFNGHYFWRYDVNAVMHAGGAPGSRVVTDVVKVGFYADAHIEVDNDYRGV